MIKEQIILFLVMFCIAMLFNMTNAMAYEMKHIYMSMTLYMVLIYGIEHDLGPPNCSCFGL